MSEISAYQLSYAQLAEWMPGEYKKQCAALRDSYNSVAVKGSEGLFSQDDDPNGKATSNGQICKGLGQAVADLSSAKEAMNYLA